MAFFCGLISAVLPAAVAVFWFAASWTNIFAAADIGAPERYHVTDGIRILAFLINILPLSVLIWGLLRVCNCFSIFASGHLFSEKAVRALQDFSLAILISSLLRPLSSAMLKVLLTWNGPPNSTIFSVTISSDTVFALLFAGTVFVIAWGMKEAIAIADENEQFV